jgi:translation initiation factor IF-2
LDKIRHTDVAAGEAGGITQHIGAYQVTVGEDSVTFIDTPGHEAFTTMRARGAQCTDIVILVVAADDGIMPQTIEAINHAKAAGVPIMVAVNKIDRPNANPSRIKQDLMKYEMVPEEFGGDTIICEVSAKTGQGIDTLLETLVIQADVLELSANAGLPASGVVIEAKLDKGRGPIATVLVQNGTLHIGDSIITGVHSGHVRAMLNDKGQIVKEAPPSTPVEVLGLSGVPSAGDQLHVVKDDKTAKDLADMRHKKIKGQEGPGRPSISLEEFFAATKAETKKTLKLLIKADVQGSAEALKAALEKIGNEKVGVEVVHSGVGGITEGDIMLAAASQAVIIGFNVRPDSSARTLAQKETVDIKAYTIIYDALDDVRKAVVGLLAPIIREKILGHAEIRNTFNIPKVGTVAGVHITDGKMLRNAHVRLLRDHVQVYQGKMSSLRRFKEDVREVQQGFECGIGLDNYSDVKIGDILEAFEMEELQATL